MRATALRWIAVLALGVALLAVVLYFASTVDGRPPQVGEIRLTQSLSTDSRVALTTSSIEVVFSESVEHAAAEAAFGIEPDVDGAFSWSGSTMIFTPDASLPLETEFTITLASGVPDEVGNRMPDPAAPFEFETVGPPRVAAVDPPDGATDVALQPTLAVTFSTLMDTASAEAAVTLRPAVAVRFSWRREVLEITPLAPLQPDRRYELVIGPGASDQAGTPIAEPSTTRFTTVASGLSVEATVPASGTQGIAVGTSIWIEVDGEIDADAIADGSLRITPDVSGTLEVVAREGAGALLEPERRVFRFTPSGPLPPTTTFRVEVAAGLRSIDGRILARDLSWTFTTGAPQPTLANQILFLSDRSGVVNLWAMNPDGSNERQVSSEMSDVTSYAAAPDGRSFVVGDGARLVAQEASGANRRVLTDAGVLEFDPAFAPDGSALVFGRADRATGSGLGIWRRAGVGGAAERLDLVSDPGASHTPDPSVGPPVPLLRAPRYAPDGGSLAWIDQAGSIVVTDVETDEQTRAPFVATEPVTWLPDSSALVVAGTNERRSGRPAPHPPSTAVAPLDLASPADPAGVLVRLATGDQRVTSLDFGTGGARLAAGTTGRVAFVELDAGGRAGTLWLSDPSLEAASQLLGDDRVARVAFAPDPRTIVVERVASDGAAAGLWLFDEATGAITKLSDDGSRPQLLP